MVARGYTTGETIVARATPRGASALSIVRLSGPDAVAVANSVFDGKSLLDVASHTASVGFLRTSVGSAVDQVVALVFRAPHTATGEDIVEFTCHGGDVASDEVIHLLTRSGARMAEPGEFTLRAFMNGKVDLAQAEAIGEMIHARSARSGRISISHLRGDYSTELSGIRGQLLELLALIELELDFSEEDVEFADRARLEVLLNGATLKINSLLDSYRLGKAITNGVRVVIAGRPNAGKSTLMNALLGYDRVIVSDIPGTTRDEIEAVVTFHGIQYQFVDTAGIRETVDVVEAEGVRRSISLFGSADIVIYLTDVSDSDFDEESDYVRSIKHSNPDLHVLFVGNKMDLVKEGGRANGFDWMLSAFKMAGKESMVTDLMDLVERTSIGSVAMGDEQQVVTSQRHQAHLEQAMAAAERATSQLGSGGSGDMLSADVRSIIDHIGSITGEVTNEEVLGKIFSSFCIGK